MASTYSELKIELITTGEQSGTWGDTTNTNLGTALGEAITGSADVTFSSGDVNLTLTDTNASQVARNLRLNITGTLGASRYLYLSTGCNIEKFYLVNNPSSYAVTVQNKIAGTPSGSTVTVPAGKSMLIYNTGTNIVDAATHFTEVSLTTPLAVTSGGTGGTTSTGSGAVVLATSPTLSSPTFTTPALGTPASGNFSSGTFTWPTFNQNTTGNALTATSATSATTATNLAGGLAFKIPYQTAADTTSFIGTPTDNTYLKYNTAGGFTWATVGGGTANALTMNNSGTGATSGTTFDGTSAQTISYNTIGASPLAGSTSLTTTGTVTTGTWSGLFGAVSGANLTTLNASNLSSGTVATARLGTGTASSSTYLRGDGTWATISTGTTTNALTMNSSGTGAVSGTTFNGSAAQTISYNTIGAAPTAGSTSITTLGTITTGTWSGTTIGINKGGTNLTSVGGANSILVSTGTALAYQELPAASFYTTATQIPTPNVLTKVVNFATGYNVGGGTFASNQYTSAVKGLYIISGTLRFNPGAGSTGKTSCGVAIYVNGVEVWRAIEVTAYDENYVVAPFSFIYPLNVSDVVSMYANVNSNATPSIWYDTNLLSTHLQIQCFRSNY